jgi:DnaJ homolog subfamily C member 1
MAPRTSILDTWFITILRTLFSRVTGMGSKHNADSADSSDAGDTTEVDETTDGLSSDANVKTNGGRQAAVKAGGRRRKLVKKN